MFVVIELQKVENQLLHLVTTFTTLNEAESDFYRVLSAAARSNVPVHAASLLNERGVCLKHEYYEHEPVVVEEE